MISIGLVFTIIGGLIGYATFYRNSKKNTKQETKEEVATSTRLDTKLDMISKNIDEIRLDIRDVRYPECHTFPVRIECDSTVRLTEPSVKPTRNHGYSVYWNMLCVNHLQKMSSQFGYSFSIKN